MKSSVVARTGTEGMSVVEVLMERFVTEMGAEREMFLTEFMTSRSDNERVEEVRVEVLARVLTMESTSDFC